MEYDESCQKIDTSKYKIVPIKCRISSLPTDFTIYPVKTSGGKSLVMQGSAKVLFSIDLLSYVYQNHLTVYVNKNESNQPEAHL